MAKTIQLPTWMKEQFETIAQCDPRLKRLKRGTARYRKRLDEIIQEMAIDTYKHSYTPGEIQGQNPWSPRIARSFFNQFKKISGENSIFAKSASEGVIPRSEIKQYQDRFRSIISHLTNMTARMKFGLVPQDFAVKKGASEEEKKQVYVNILVRYFYATLFIQVTRSVMEMTPEQVSDFFEDLGITDKASLELLASQNQRLRFVDGIRETVASRFSSETLLKILRS